MLSRLYNDPNLFTIVIPTKNRPTFLARSFDFLESQGFTGQVLIADGSDDTSGNENQRITNDSRIFRTVYIHSGDLGHTLKESYEGLKEIKSKYILYCHDDDFYFLDEIDRCLGFLEHNEDYVSAKGCFIWLSRFPNKKNKLSSQKMFSYSDPIGESRLMSMFRRYCHLHFAVMRRDAFLYVAKQVPKYLGLGWFDQFAHTLIVGVLGKSHTFEGLYCIRQDHQGQHHRHMIKTSPYSHFPMILASPDFSKIYQDFRRCLITSCRNFVSVNDEELGKILDQGLLLLIKRGFVTTIPPEKWDLEVMKRLQKTDSAEQRKIHQVFPYLTPISSD